MASPSADGFSLDRYFDVVRTADLTPLSGRVVRVERSKVDS